VKVVALLTFLIGVGSVGFAGTVHAQAMPADAALATELFNAGRDLMKDAQYAAACPKLAESARLDVKVGTLARLAECDERLGHVAVARSHWQQALNLARSSGDPRAAHVESELTRIDRVVPKIEIVFSGEPPRDLVLELDDVQLGVASLGVKLPVEPGPHTLRASTPGKRPAIVAIDVAADGAVSRVILPALVSDADPVPPVATSPASSPSSAPPPDAVPRESSAPWRTVGLASAGVGVVAIGVGSVFGVMAKSKRDDSYAQPGGCVNDDCPPAAARTREDARSAGNTATVFFVAGGILAAAGVTMFLVAPAPSAHALRVAPSVAQTDARLTLEGRF
jgi:hypothetical protein